MKKICFSLLYLLLTIKPIFPADYIGGIEEGMGGTSFAISSLNGSLFSNPALYSFNHIYTVELFGFLQGEPSAYGARASIVDTVSSPLSGGLAFSYREEKDGGPVKMDVIFNLARAYSIFAGGVNFKYHMLRKLKNDDSFIMDFGAGLRLYREHLYLGIVGENAVSYGLRDKDVKWGTGCGIGGNLIKKVIWGFDYIRREDENTYRGGLEFLFLHGMLGVRGGFSYDDTTGKKIGAGISIYGPKLLINYAFSMFLDAPETKTHLLSLIFVPIR